MEKVERGKRAAQHDDEKHRVRQDAAVVEQGAADEYHRIRRSQAAEEHDDDDGGIADYAVSENRVSDARHYQ